MKKVSVIGASGFIGRRLCRYAREHGEGRVIVTGTWHSRPGAPGDMPLDVTDAAAIAAHLESDYDVVVLAAGTKDVRRCEQDFEHARALNVAPVEEMLRTIQRKGLRTRIIYLSTDYVFDGERGSYRDEDETAPRTGYGRSKELAERAVLGAGGGHKVVRSGAVMGRGGVFFDWLLRELAGSGELRLFSDSFNSPTPIELLSEFALELIDEIDDVPSPIIHVVGERRLSRYELARIVAELLPACDARLVPEGGALAGTLFQPDLSLIRSAFVERRHRPSLEQYLSREVRGC